MADIKVHGQMLVKTFREQFKSEFGLTLRVYNGPGFAKDDVSLASIRKGDNVKAVDEVKVAGNRKVGTLEKDVLNAWGIKVQVASGDNTFLVNNDLTLAEAGRQHGIKK